MYERSIGKRLPYLIGYGLSLVGFVTYFIFFRLWLFCAAAVLLFGSTIYLSVIQKLERSAMDSYMPYMRDRGDHDAFRSGRYERYGDNDRFDRR